MKSQTLLLAFFFILCIGFLAGLLIPVEYLPLDNRQDKQHHIVIFALLTLATRVCLPVRGWLAFVFVTVLAGLAELSQLLVEYRSTNWLDMQANLQGIAIATTAILLFDALERWKRHRKRKVTAID